MLNAILGIWILIAFLAFIASHIVLASKKIGDWLNRFSVNRSVEKSFIEMDGLGDFAKATFIERHFRKP